MRHKGSLKIEFNYMNPIGKLFQALYNQSEVICSILGDNYHFRPEGVRSNRYMGRLEIQGDLVAYFEGKVTYCPIVIGVYLGDLSFKTFLVSIIEI